MQGQCVNGNENYMCGAVKCKCEVKGQINGKGETNGQSKSQR